MSLGLYLRVILFTELGLCLYDCICVPVWVSEEHNVFIGIHVYGLLSVYVLRCLYVFLRRLWYVYVCMFLFIYLYVCVFVCI